MQGRNFYLLRESERQDKKKRYDSEENSNVKVKSCGDHPEVNLSRNSLQIEAIERTFIS